MITPTPQKPSTSPSPLELRLDRVEASPDCTIGRLYSNGRFECWTLEDQIRTGAKVAGKTAIPSGRYRVLISFSNRFKRYLPLLLNVPGFEGIRIHSGNTAEDTEGCILVGQRRVGKSVLSSRAAMQVLQERIVSAIAAGRAVWIQIDNPTSMMIENGPED